VYKDLRHFFLARGVGGLFELMPYLNQQIPAANSAHPGAARNPNAHRETTVAANAHLPKKHVSTKKR
jgi:hypothetical protein